MGEYSSSLANVGEPGSACRARRIPEEGAQRLTRLYWVLGDEDRPPPHKQNRAAAYITWAANDLRDFAHVVVSISQNNVRASSIAIQF